MKKTLAAILALVMVLSMLPAGMIMSSALTEGDYTYTVSSSKATISAYSGPGGALNIPGELGGYPVIGIGANVFSSKASITSVVIPDSVTAIGTSAFQYCTKLTNVTIGSGLATLGTDAFTGCSANNGFNVSSENNSFSSQDGVLFNQAKTALILYPCNKSGTYIIPDTVTEIRAKAFFLCVKLSEVEIRNGITTIGDDAFNLSTLSGNLTIPDSVTSIGNRAFNGCDMTSLNIGSGITSLGSEVFGQCSSLTSVVIPPAINSIGNSAFNRCTKLVAAYFLGNTPVNVGTSVFDNCAAGFTVLYNSDKTGFGSTWYTYLTAVYGDLVAVCFDLNGGSGNPGACMSPGAALTAPTVTKYGNSFSGWSPAVPSSVPAVNSTYVAQWTPNSYTVVYNGNGATGGSTASSAHNYGVAKNLTANGFTKTGYTFSGWATSAGGVVAYSDAQSVSGLTSTNGATVTLYAKWTALNGAVSITFDANGGAGGSTTSLIPGAALTSPTVTKTGYTIAGWSPAVPATVPTSNTTYTVQWAANSYTIHYDGNGFTDGCTADSSHTYNLSANLTANGFAKTGSTFLGWSTDAGAATATYIDTQSVVNLTANQNGIVTLYAIWVENPYTVTFNTNGGSAVTAITQSVNTAVAKPADPVKTGYTFGGWYTEAGLTGAVTWPYTLTGDVTFYAKWTAITVTITWNPNGGKWPDGTTGSKTTTTLDCPGVLTKTGWSFIGWSPAVPPTMPLVNTTFTAQWRIDAHSLYFNANGGTGSMSPVEPDFEGWITVPPCTFIRTGYTFSVWNTATDGSGTVVEAGTFILLLPSDLTLYAQWTSNEPAPADYTQLNALIAQAEGLDRHIYTEDSLMALDDALSCAYDAVDAEYDSSMQDTVDEAADLLQAALTALEYIPVDYSELNNCLESVPDNDGGQATVDWDYLYLNYPANLVDNLKYAIGLAISIIRGGPQPDVYPPIDWRPILIDAIMALYLYDQNRPADYTYLGLALNNAPAWPASYYTEDTYLDYTDELVTGWALYNNQNLSSTQQFIINDATQAINEAYAALTLKDVTYTVKYQTTGGTTLAADAVKNATAADWVTETAVAVPGYTPVQATIQQRITGTSAENIIQFTYAANPYTVTFESNGGSAVAPITGQAGNPLTPPADPTKTGYLFSGWYVDSGLTAAVTWPYTIAGNITFYAKWTPTTTYKITFNSNGGSSVAAITQNANTAVAKPADPVKTGYTFKGWYLESNFTNAVTWPYTLAANVTFYAKWTRNYYTVTFDAQGGTVDPVNRSIGFGYSYSPLPTPVKTGFVFMGWYTQPDGLGNRIIAADGVEIAQDHTLYAKWMPVTNVTVTLNAMGGMVSPAAVTLTVGLPYGNLPVPTKAGYTFGGWYQSPPSYLSYDYVLSNFIVAKDFDHTLYAKWNNPRYNLSFDSNGGSGGMLLGYSLPAGTMVTISLFPYFTVNFNLPPGEDPIFVPQVMLELPTRPGYTFAGWSMSSFVMPAHDVTVYAIWSPNPTASVISAFDTNGGSAIAPISGNPGDPFTAPADPTRAGYTFMGWSPSIPPSVPDGDSTYTAIWQANCYMITFNANGGTGSTSITLDYGSPLIPPAVARAGFVFAGWSTMLPATVGAGDADYTALWRMLGDLNGNDSVTSADALMALQASAELISPTEIQVSAADVNQSGTVTSADALKILQYSAGLITSF